jgi:hypothetical protein
MKCMLACVPLTSHARRPHGWARKVARCVGQYVMIFAVNQQTSWSKMSPNLPKGNGVKRGRGVRGRGGTAGEVEERVPATALAQSL